MPMPTGLHGTVAKFGPTSFRWFSKKSAVRVNPETANMDVRRTLSPSQLCWICQSCLQASGGRGGPSRLLARPCSLPTPKECNKISVPETFSVLTSFCGAPGPDSQSQKHIRLQHGIDQQAYRGPAEQRGLRGTKPPHTRRPDDGCPASA